MCLRLVVVCAVMQRFKRKTEARGTASVTGTIGTACPAESKRAPHVTLFPFTVMV